MRMHDSVQKVIDYFNEIRRLKREAEIKEVDVEYMSDTSAATMQGAPIVYHYILIVSALFLLVGLIWANFAVLDVVTVGQGKVIPSRNLQTIQNLEGGIVKDIRVKVGELYVAIVTRVCVSTFRMKKGYFFKFDSSRVVLLNKKGTPIGTRVFGPCPKELRSRKNLRIITLSTGLL